MPIKLIIFDLDGTLVSCKRLHRETLNMALSHKGFRIEEEELPLYEALTTRQKLDKLTNEKGLQREDHDIIWDIKQRLTLRYINDYVERLPHIIDMLDSLSDYKLAICTNSIRKTTEEILRASDILEYFPYIITNQDVANPKPNSQPYFRTMGLAGENPINTLIFEDSQVGLTAAYRSRAFVCPVTDPFMIGKDYVHTVLGAINEI